MRIEIKVQNTTTGSVWSEEYDTDILASRTLAGRIDPESQDPELWGRTLIKWFNATTLPGESKRSHISAKRLDV